MSLIHVVLLTLLNTVACLALPKLLSLFTEKSRAQKSTHVEYNIESEELATKAPSFL